MNKKTLIIIIAALSQLTQQLIANMTVVALPDIIIDLNFHAGNILWVNLIYLVALVASCIPFAKIIAQLVLKDALRLV